VNACCASFDASACGLVTMVMVVASLGTGGVVTEVYVPGATSTFWVKG